METMNALFYAAVFLTLATVLGVSAYQTTSEIASTCLALMALIFLMLTAVNVRNAIVREDDDNQ
jgi:integral membrane sensor domain MASE1